MPCHGWLSKQLIYSHKLNQPIYNVASFPGLPRFSFTIYTAGEERGRPGNIRHVNDIRWTWREGLHCQNDTLDHPFERSIAVLAVQMLAWSKLLILASRKLTVKFSTYVFVYRPLPLYVHLASTHVINAPRHSFFAGLPTPVYYCECKRKLKTREA